METRQPEVHLVRYSREQFCIYLDNFRRWISGTCSTTPVERYIELGDTVVRIVMYDESFLSTIQVYFSCSIVEPSQFEYTIVMWKVDGFFGKQGQTFRFLGDSSARTETNISFCANGYVRGYDADSNTFYCGYPSTDIDCLIYFSDPLLGQLHNIIGKKSSALVHGACVGVDGKGVLLCARGGKGKSTLAVSALLGGFDFVSDDYLIVDRKGDSLYASPIYSTVKLSHCMYEQMRDGLLDSPIVSDIKARSKYVIGISPFKSSIRTGYPIQVCMMPLIVHDLEKPEIVRCSEEEKRSAVVHIVHSTISQLTNGRNNSYNLKLMQMFQDQIFYKILLSPDIHANVECLRSFLVRQFSE